MQWSRSSRAATNGGANASSCASMTSGGRLAASLVVEPSVITPGPASQLACNVLRRCNFNVCLSGARDIAPALALLHQASVKQQMSAVCDAVASQAAMRRLRTA